MLTSRLIIYFSALLFHLLNTQFLLKLHLPLSESTSDKSVVCLSTHTAADRVGRQEVLLPFNKFDLLIDERTNPIKCI